MKRITFLHGIVLISIGIVWVSCKTQATKEGNSYGGSWQKANNQTAIVEPKKQISIAETNMPGLKTHAASLATNPATNKVSAIPFPKPKENIWHSDRLDTENKITL